MSFVYILHSKKSDHYYIGSTTDLNRRLTEYNRGQTTSTKHSRPWICVFSEECDDAKQIEKRLKKLKSKVILEKIIANQFLV